VFSFVKIITNMMKKITKMKGMLLALFLITLLYSCKKEEASALKSGPPIDLMSRPIKDGDPNLNPDWDWTVQEWTVYFNNSSGSVGVINTLNPFIDGSQKIFGNTDIQKADMYAKDGWMLVSRDFGTPTEGNAYPFFILYNKYRGVLRVGILRTIDVLSSYQRIDLSFAKSASYPDFFRFAGKINNGADDQFIQSAITYAGAQQWMIADFDLVGYSANIDDNLAFNISMSEVVESDVKVVGDVHLNGLAQPQSAGTSGLGIVNKVYSFFTSNSEAIGKITAKNPTSFDLSGAGVFLNGALKLVSGLSGGSNTPYKIELNGSIQNSGTITITSPKTSFSVYVKPKIGTLAYRALSNIPWGVFNTVGLSISQNYIPVTEWVPIQPGDPNPDGGTGYEVVVGYDIYRNMKAGSISQSLVINPELQNDISKIEGTVITYDWNKAPDGSNVFATDFVELANFDSKDLIYAEYYKVPHKLGIVGIGLKITFKNGVVVYKKITG
jgi:hypothetical protein